MRLKSLSVERRLPGASDAVSGGLALVFDGPSVQAATHAVPSNISRRVSFSPDSLDTMYLVLLANGQWFDA